MAPRIPGPRPGGDHNLLDLFLPQLQAYVENLPILGDLVEAFTGREDGDPNDIGSMINNLKSWVGGLFGFRASISSQVKELQGLIATGAQFYDSFDRGEDTGALGNGWTQGGDGQPLGIRDQAAQIIQGGVTATPGRRWAKSPQAASGDTFTVSMVTHPIAPSQYAETWLFARMNAAFTEGLVLRMVAGKCWLSRVSRPSGTSNAWTLTAIAENLTKSYTKSATVEFKGEENVLQVSIDSVIVMTATDTAHAIDAAHRSNGFAEQTTTAALGFAPSYSGGLASYSLKSVAVLDTVVNTATSVAVAKVAPVADAVTAGATQSTMPAGADPVVYAAQRQVADDAAFAAQASTNAQIAIQQQQQSSNTSGGGMKKLFQFSSGALNSTDWTSNTGAFVQSNNQLTLSGNVAVGTFWIAKPNYTFNTDDQALSALLGDNANNDQPTFLILRADSTGATGVACRITANSLKIGTIAFGGDGASSAGFTEAQGVTIGLGSGDSIEFRAIGNQFSVFKNGVSVLSYTGSLGTAGSTRRSAAVIMNKAQAVFVYYSFNLRSFGMNDYGTTGQAVSSRTSAKLSRSGVGEVSMSVGSGGYAVVPSNYFGSVDYAQGMTVTDLAAGKIRIDTPGWYQVAAAFQSRYTGETAYYGQPWWCLILNGNQASPGIPGGVSLPVALAAGDIIQPGVVNYQGSVVRTSNGDAAVGETRPATLDRISGNGSFFQAVFDI